MPHVRVAPERLVDLVARRHSPLFLHVHVRYLRRRKQIERHRGRVLARIGQGVVRPIEALERAVHHRLVDGRVDGAVSGRRQAVQVRQVAVAVELLSRRVFKRGLDEWVQLPQVLFRLARQRVGAAARHVPQVLVGQAEVR